MADNTKIEWTDATWNPIRARRLIDGEARIGWHCEHASPGCVNCYAEKMNKTGRSKFTGTRLPYKPGHRKDVEIFLNEKKLLEPLRWREPRKIFVCSMTDLFGEFVTDEMIEHVFAVMALCPQHTFQVLTKRSARMREHLAVSFGRIADRVMQLRRSDLAKRRGMGPSAVAPLPHITPGAEWWPLANVWLGVSVEDRERMMERAPDLKATPAAVHFWSAEPLIADLGVIPLELMPDWMICGGESGPNARPLHPDWARSLRDQCAAAGVAFHFKQWGEWLPGENYGEPLARWQDGNTGMHPTSGRSPRREWSHFGKVGEWGAFAIAIGKKRAGRLLDGHEHNGFPT